jgi:hypothetical protein
MPSNQQCGGAAASQQQQVLAQQNRSSKQQRQSFQEMPSSWERSASITCQQQLQMPSCQQVLLGQ